MISILALITFACIVDALSTLTSVCYDNVMSCAGTSAYCVSYQCDNTCATITGSRNGVVVTTKYKCQSTSATQIFVQTYVDTDCSVTGESQTLTCNGKCLSNVAGGYYTCAASRTDITATLSVVFVLLAFTFQFLTLRNRGKKMKNLQVITPESKCHSYETR